MKEIIKRVPLPLCGVMLGLAALGNLLQSYSETVRCICGIAAAVLLALVLLKLFLFPAKFGEDMGSPIMASVAGTFPMALMLLSVYAKPWLGGASQVIWFLAILLHLALIVYFTVKFFVSFSLTKVFASWFIVYVGIAVAAVTAPAYGKLWIGSAAFWFGLVCAITLLVLVTLRYVKRPDVPNPAKPLMCIYAAPLSLCLVGYVQSIPNKSFGFMMAMYAAACILYVFSLIKAVGYLKLPFYPSYAAFTFPFVISAIASKQVMVCLGNMGRAIPALKYVVLAQTVIAAAAVLYTLLRFAVSLMACPPPAKAGSDK